MEPSSGRSSCSPPVLPPPPPSAFTLLFRHCTLARARACVCKCGATGGCGVGRHIRDVVGWATCEGDGWRGRKGKRGMREAGWGERATWGIGGRDHVSRCLHAGHVLKSTWERADVVTVDECARRSRVKEHVAKGRPGQRRRRR